MNKKIALSIITAFSLSTLNAYEMRPVGFKATGMGGTGVASTRGSLSGYYNPALLRFSDYTAEFGINAGIRVRESNIIDNMDKLNKLDFDGTTDRIANNTPFGNKQNGTLYVAGSDNTDDDKRNIIEAQNILKSIGTENAFQLSVTPSLTAQMSDALAIGVYSNIDVAFRLNINPNYTDLIFKDTNTGKYYQYDPTDENHPGHDIYTLYSDDNAGRQAYESSSLEYANNNGINYVQVDTMALAETPISYAKAYDWDSGTWSFGVSVKPMILVTTTQKANLGESSDDADDDSDTYETTYKPTIGLDLGIAYRPTDSKMTLGLVGKNINSPKFKVDTSKTGRTEDYEIDPFFRAGLSIPIWNDNIEFAFDVDLQKSDTLIEGEKSQFIGAGIELHPASWFAFRVGAMQDMASEKFDDGTIVTAGLGFGLKWAQIDISAMAGTNTGEFDGQTIPRYMAVNIALVSRWGDGYNRKQPPEPTENIENKTKQKIQNLSPEDRNRIQEKSDKAFEELDRS